MRCGFPALRRRYLRKPPEMDILYLLIPLSVVLVFVILAALGWAIYRGQFDDVEREGKRILDHD